jgi:hypothetical protein
LEAHLRGIDAADAQHYREAAERFLASAEAARFAVEGFVEPVAAALGFR